MDADRCAPRPCAGVVLYLAGGTSRNSAELLNAHLKESAGGYAETCVNTNQTPKVKYKNKASKMGPPKGSVTIHHYQTFCKRIARLLEDYTKIR